MPKYNLRITATEVRGGGGNNDESGGSGASPTPSAIGSIKGIIGMTQPAAEMVNSSIGFGPKAQATDLTLLTVHLTDEQNITFDTHPDASGRFSFEDIPVGFYILTIEPNEAFPLQAYYHPNAYVTVEAGETLDFSIPAVRSIPLGITDFLPPPDAGLDMKVNVSQTAFSTLDINEVSGRLLLSNNSSRLVRVTDSGPEAESQVEVFEVNGTLLGKDDTEELLYFSDTISVDGQEECHIYVRSGVDLSIVTDLNFETVCPAAAIDETNNRLYLYAEADSKLTIVENGLERAENVDITGVSGTMIVSENSGGVLYFTSERMISTLNGSDGARLGDVDFSKPGMGDVQDTVVNPATGELYVTYGVAKRGWTKDEPWLLIVSGSGTTLLDEKLSDALGCVPTGSSGGVSGVSVSASKDGGSSSSDDSGGSGSECTSPEEMEVIYRCSAAMVDYYGGGYYSSYDDSYDDSPTLLFFREDESNMVYINGIKFSVSGADFAVIIPQSKIDFYEDNCVSGYYPVRLFFPRGKVIDYTRDFYYSLQTNLESEWWYETGYLGVGRYPMDDNSDIMVYVGLLYQDQAGLSGLVVNRVTGRVYTFDPNSNELLVLE